MTVDDVIIELKILLANLFTRARRSAPLVGIIAAVAGPIILLAIGGNGGSNLPWYIWTIALLVLVLVIATGRYMYMLDSREAEISISPRQR